MKKFIVYIVGGMLLLSCDLLQKKATSANDDTDDGSELTMTEYSYSFHDEEQQVDVSIKVDFPDGGSEVLTNAIAEAIDEQLGGLYEGPLDDGQAMVDYYGETYRQELVGGIVPDDEYYTDCYRNVSITVGYETENLVTLIVQYDSFSPGAIHGYESNYGITLRKSDGRRFSTDMMHSVGDAQFCQILKKGLMDYFSSYSGDDVNTDDKLEEYILGADDINYLPMPKHDPFIKEEGITFAYQPYEISFYAAGAPTFSVPCDELKDYLSNPAKKMLDM